MTLHWCEYAWLGGSRIAAEVSLEASAGVLTAITTGVTTPPKDAVVLRGLTLPAFANVHSHAFHRALRGRTHTGSGSFWTWRDLMYRVAGRLNPDNYFALAKAVFSEMAQAGVGVVGEFHYVHHQPDGTAYADPNAMGHAVLAAAQEVGVRITLLDTLYLHGGLAGEAPKAEHLSLRPEQRRFADASVQEWANRVSELEASLVFGSSEGGSSEGGSKSASEGEKPAQIGAAIHSVRAVDPDAMHAAAVWARSHAAPLHVHVSEQPAENEASLAAFGLTPTALLDSLDVLDSTTTLIHTTHMTASDIAILAAAGAASCFCPSTEADLADGIGPSGELSAAGVKLSLGSDSNAAIDLLGEARALELNQRLLTQRRGTHSALDLADACTSNGYEALGWGDGGRLGVGSLADFTTVSLDSVRLTGSFSCATPDSAPDSVPDSALASVIFAGTAADVTSLTVAGKQIVAESHHVTIDVARELQRSIAEVSP